MIIIGNESLAFWAKIKSIIAALSLFLGICLPSFDCPRKEEPSLRIILPATCTSFHFSDQIHLVATSSGNVVNIEWISDRDGILGVGKEIKCSNLSVGSAEISIRGFVGGE